MVSHGTPSTLRIQIFPLKPILYASAYAMPKKTNTFQGGFQSTGRTELKEALTSTNSLPEIPKGGNETAAVEKAAADKIKELDKNVKELEADVERRIAEGTAESERKVQALERKLEETRELLEGFTRMGGMGVARDYA